MLPYRDNRLTGVLLTLFLCAVLGYGYFEARGILYGPMIDVPSAPTVSHDPLVHIRGQARNITSLSMNGMQIPVAEDGAFDEPYLLAVGYNRTILTARDKYGASTTRFIEIMYEPLAIEAATSTTTSSTPSVAPAAY